MTKIALVGNPNCGKTTIFNNLTGSSQYVGNWPGVTVEKKEGKYKTKDIIITDLPGVYSLSPYTPEEDVSRRFLVNESPAAVINVVDASNLERNLYLTLQLIEIGLPMCVTLNMTDIVEKRGDSINFAELSTALGVPVIKTTATKGIGTDEAVKCALLDVKNTDNCSNCGKCGRKKEPIKIYSKATENALKEIEELLKDKIPDNKIRWYAVKVFERDHCFSHLKDSRIEKIIAKCEQSANTQSDAIITMERYEFINKIIKNCYFKNSDKRQELTKKIDSVVTNRWLALPIFIAVMFGVYYIAISGIGTIASKWTTDVLFGEWLTGAAENMLKTAPLWLNGLVINGIIGGVGAVLGFLPQLCILFIFLCLLEDCGYMARGAFIMDRIFHTFGLSGKSFIPYVVSTGCGVPAIMATRTIEDENERRLTIMTATFIPCGAKFPVIALTAGVLSGAAWVAPTAYFIGIAAVFMSALLLRKLGVFKKNTSPFLMELPQYHIPSLKSIALHVWDRIKSFIIKAGSVILIACVLVWFLENFGFINGVFGMVDAENSILATIGKSIAPIFIPLGFGNWQAAVAVLTGIVAKENLVGTLGVLLSSSDLPHSVLSLFNFPAAAMFSFLIFNQLCIPCVAAIGAIRREMASAKWTAFALIYQMIFAYTIAFIIYRIWILCS